MPDKPILRPLKDLRGISEVVGLGRLRENPHGGTEALVEVLIAPDIWTRDKAKKAQLISIGVGQLGLLYPGGRFKAGEKTADVDGGRFSGRVSHLFNRRETLGSGIFKRTAAGTTTDAIAGAPGWLLRFEGHQLSGDTKPTVVFLPALELVRAIFGSSSDLLKQLIDGRRDPQVNRSRYSVDRSRCGVDEHGRVTLSVSRKVSRADAIVLGALFADRSGHLLKFHDMVHQGLATEPAFHTSSGAYLDLDWPFSEGIDLQFVGRWLFRDGVAPEGAPIAKSRFVITQIEKVVFPSPPAAIKVLYPSDIEDDGEQVSQGKRLAPIRDTREVRSDRSPDNYRQSETLRIDAPTFNFSDSIDVEFAPGQVFLGRKEHGLRAQGNDGEHYLATDDAIPSGDKSTGQVRLHGSTPTNDVDAPTRERRQARRLTWEALELLADKKSWKISYWTGNEESVAKIIHDADDPDADVAKVATVETAHGLKGIADAGSATGAPASIGVVSATTRRDARLLAKDLFGCTGVNNWRWMRQGTTTSHHAFINLKGHPRSSKCWINPEHYAAKLADWLD